MDNLTSKVASSNNKLVNAYAPRNQNKNKCSDKGHGSVTSCLSGNYDILTDRHTYMRGHKEVTLPISDAIVQV